VTIALALALLVIAVAPALADAPVTAPGQLYAFGSNMFGQLGVAENAGTATANPTPALVTLPGSTGPVVRVATGIGHSLAVTSTGQLFAFGYNYYGQLGSAVNNSTTNANPTPALVSLPGATGTVTDVAAGDEFSLALTATGQLYSFGINAQGQLGIATNSGTLTPTPTPALVSLPGATGPVAQIAAGALHALALTSTGQLYAFGYNYYGQLGSTVNIATSTANPTPAIVGLPGATGLVSAIGAGVTESFAATTTGQLFAFGANDVGQLGIQSNGLPVSTPTLVGLPGATGTVTDIVSGGEHTLVVTSGGQLYGFGTNDFGQLGTSVNSGTTVANATPLPITLPAATGRPMRIGNGYEHSLALTSTGQLYGFGFNHDGALGIPANSGTMTPNPVPAQVDLPGATFETVSQSVDGLQTLAVTSDLTIATASLPSGQAGVPYAATVQAAGGISPYTWSASGLPAGLSIDGASGQIAGTPTAAASGSAVITVTDADGIAASSPALPLAITAAATSAPITQERTPTAARIRASLLSQLAPKGTAARIAALLKAEGYSRAFKALASGGLTIDWYFLPKGARLTGTTTKPVLVAHGKRTFRSAGSLVVTIRLTARGRHLLENRSRLRITAKGTFARQGAAADSTTKTMTLTH
jgi:alpha-tubulin suppressor-like RCC1 family protein